MPRTATITRPLFTHTIQAFLMLFMLLLLCLNASAQSGGVANERDGTTPLGMTPGAPAGSYSLSGFDNINYFNGNLNFTLPLLHVGGRGGVGYTIPLTIERKWSVDKTIAGPNLYYPDSSNWSTLNAGYGPGVLNGRVVGAPEAPCSDVGSSRQTLTRLTFSGPDGTEYELYDQLSRGAVGQSVYGGPECQVWSTTARGRVFIDSDGGANATFTSDVDIFDAYGESISQIRPSGYLMLRDGRRYRIDEGRVTWIRDRNGNQIKFEYNFWGVTKITDSLNRFVTIEYASDAANGHPTYDLISYKGFNAAPRQIRIFRSALDAPGVLRAGFSRQTYHDLFPELSGASSYSYFTPTVISAVELPDSRRYEFRYNSYGELARVELPTGGAIEYDHAAGIANSNTSGSIAGSGGAKHVYRRVIERRVYPNGGTTWESKATISRPADLLVVDPGYVAVETRDAANTLLTNERHYYYGNATSHFEQQPTGYPYWKDGKEWKTELFDIVGGSPSLRRQIVHTWSQPTWNTNWPLTQSETSDTVRPNHPQITETVTTLAETNQVCKQSFAYDQYGNRTDVYEYDYGNGTPGPLVRRTHTDYLTTNPVNGSNYTTGSIHMRGLPTQQQVFDAVGVERARTTYEYDNYANDIYHALLVDRTGITGLDSSFTMLYETRGNTTRVSQWLLPAGTSINNYTQYDIAGNVVRTIDGREKALEVGYSSTYQYAYPTSTTSPIPDPTGNYGSNTALTTSTDYDYSTGLVTSSTDANGKTTTIAYNDLLDRPTLVTRPSGGGWTSYQYGDTAGTLYVRTQVLQNTSGAATDSYRFFDGLGRAYRSFQYVNSDPSNPWLTSDTKYDCLGRVWKVSNPYWSTGSTSAINPSGNWTATAYDGLSRVLTVTTPDGAQAVTTYNGNQVTVNDQAGKKRSSTTDALGRLTQVIEDPAGLAYQTTYTYDVVGNLRAVQQGTQPARYFMYDSLSRLIRAKNLEQDTNSSLSLSDPITGNNQWSLGYSYDANGNLLTRTDARNVTSTYVYDALNRNTIVSYSDSTPTVTRLYDGAINGKGRPWASYSGFVSHTAIDSYDAMGRPLTQRQHFYANGSWGTPYATYRVYDLAGHVTSQTYPSGKAVAYAYDQAGRTSDFTGNLGDNVTRTYAGSISYDQWNGLSREQFGTATPLYHKELRNIRGQLFDTRLSSVNDTWDWNRGRLISYYSSNHVWGQSGTDNNGNVLSQENWIPPANATLDQVETLTEDHYTYDSLNRLSSVIEDRMSNPGSGWVWAQQFAQGYSYDRYGNRTINAAQTWGTGINSQQFTVDPDTNRLGVPAGLGGVMSYDFAGNLVNDTYSGAGTRTYDAENRMVTATNKANQQSVYTYDADGRRVRRNSYNQETWQVYGMEGELLAEYSANAAPTSPQKEYGYRNGQLLVTASAPSRVNFAASANGASASASSTNVYNGNPFPASKAIDGDHRGLNYVTGGVWQSSSTSLPQWLQVDFQGSKTIDEIDLFTLQDNYASPGEPTETMQFAWYGPTSFEVQYWTGSSWVTVSGGSVTNNNKVWRKFSFTAITTSKIRVLTSASPDGWSRVAELEAWGPSAPSRTNVALSTNGSSATASSNYSDPAYGYNPGAAINDERKGSPSSSNL